MNLLAVAVSALVASCLADAQRPLPSDFMTSEQVRAEAASPGSAAGRPRSQAEARSLARYLAYEESDDCYAWPGLLVDEEMPVAAPTLSEAARGGLVVFGQVDGSPRGRCR